MSQETSLQRIFQSFKKLEKECSKKQITLRNSIQNILDYINQIQNTTQQKTNDIKLNENGVPLDIEELDKLGNKLIIPLKLACETRNIKLMGPALDIIHKLIDYGYFRGLAIDEENTDKKLMNKVIVTVSNCFDFPDDNIQLKIIKTFLSAVASPVCDIHETLLLNAIRTCYNIYLLSRSTLNQNTAKGTLTQMLNIIFQRMELQMSPDIVIGIDDSFEEELDKQINRDKDKGRPSIDGSLTSVSEIKQLQKIQSGINEENEIQKNQELLLSSLNQLDKKEKLEININDFIKNIIFEIIEKAFSFTKNIKLSETTNIQSSQENIKKNGNKEGNYHIFTDCYLVFRALCKLSMKEIPKESSADLNSLDLKSKILSLELLLTILENSGPVFRSCDKFINSAIKKYLIISVLTNGASSNSKVFRLSLSIFLSLIANFKDYLKNEIGVFYSKILLNILESNNSSLSQKWTVLQVLLQICKNPQTLVDIFVNYDCDLEHKDIYERMVNDLSKIVQKNVSLENTGEQKLKVLGLECLVNITKSLAEWSKDLRIDFEETEKRKDSNLNIKELDNSTKEKSEHNEENIDGFKVKLGKLKSADFTVTKQQKSMLTQGINKFNSNPKKGMRFLLEHGLIEKDPLNIAKFLKTNEGLDKTAIGDYIGDGDDFNKQVMHCYVDLFSFKNLEIDIAIRKFLATFRLPGESQKIDRLMEKFAERYFADNPEAGFGNADAVYILSFAIIMLATDLHSPSIKTKMTKQEWIKFQSKNNDGKDFDKELLSSIYDRIAAQELKLQDDNFNVDNNFTTDPKQLKNRFQKEMERNIWKSKQLLKEKAKDKSTYHRTKQLEVVQPMFEITWCPMLAAFSILLEDSSDSDIIRLVLDGIKYSIRITCTFFMEVERNSFVSTLAKFTFLNNVREIKQKNIESIKTLMEIAKTEANYLQDSWLAILRCISHLEELHLVGQGAKTQAFPFLDESANNNNNNNSNNTSRLSTSKNMSHTKKKSISVIQFDPHEITNAHIIVDQIDVMAVDKIFSNSIHLNSSAIEDFVRCLCIVSQDEIESPNPRMFSLQKLVEIAHFNMGRIRLVWSRIWCILADHFTKVACNENLSISMYAIDSLKQLAMKFLEKNELANYHFQKEFLKPFEHIMINNNKNTQIKDMIIRCLQNMILVRANNIKSGWKTIFVVATNAAPDSNESIVSLSFEMIQEIINKYFHLISDSFFIDCVNCLVAYGNCRVFIEICLRSINSLKFCADQLAVGNVIPLTKNESEQVIFTDNDKYLSHWFPILTGLSGIIGHTHIDIRTAALKTLFGILTSYGKMFNNGFWQLIFRGVLLPIFDNVRYAGEKDLIQEDNEWLTTTCLPALNALIELFSEFLYSISFLLNDLLNLLSNCILQDNESLARIGATCFLQLVMTNGTKFNEEMWTEICSNLSFILEKNTPTNLLNELEENIDLFNNEVFEKKENRTSIEKKKSYEKQNQETQYKDVENSQKIVIKSEITTTIPLTPETLKRQNIPKTFNQLLKIVLGKCTVQLGLIEVLNEIAFTHYSNLATNHLEIILNSLESCYHFSYHANTNLILRNRLAKTGLLDRLQRQETASISCYLRVLYRMYAETLKDHENRNAIAEKHLEQKWKQILADFIHNGLDKEKYADKADFKRVINAYTQIIVQILKGIAELDDNQFKKHLSLLYPLLTELLLTESKDIRLIIRNIFLRIGKIQNIFVENNISS